MSGKEPLPFVLRERIEHNPRLAVFRVAPLEPGSSLPSFQAGQHIRVSVPGEGGRWSVRPLSIASAPEERRWLEFLVSRSGSADDPFVERLWALREGDGVRVAAGADGRLTPETRLRSDGPRLAVFVASGTGIAPFASTVRSWTFRGDAARLSRTAVLHGVARPADFAYGEVFRTGVGASRYLQTVSRPGEHEGWTGATGRVESHLGPGRIETTERALGLPPGSIVPGRAAVFVCGFPETVARAEAALASRGYARETGALFTEG